MPHLRHPLALGLAAALVLPLASGAAPALADPVDSPAPSATEDDRTAAGVEELRQARELSGAEAAATTGIGAATAINVSDGVRSWRVTVDATGAKGTTTVDTTRTDVVVAPGGDAFAYTPTSGTPRTVVRAIGASDTTEYAASDEPVAWGPLGDGFVQLVGGEYVAQETNPGMAAIPLDAPAGASAPAVTPYGGSVVMRVPAAGAGTDLAVVPNPLSGTESTTTTVPLGLDQYSPGAPAAAQEPGAGVFFDNDGSTYVAFVGDVPGSNPAQRRLFVDHQDGDPANATGGYGAPVAVADAGSSCDVAAPAFTPDRGLLAFVRSTASDCSAFEVRVVKVGGDGRFAAGSSSTLLWSSATGAPAPTVLSWQPKNPRAFSLRVSGNDRYQVAANVSASFYETGSADGVVLAGGVAYADALTGGPLAVHQNGPTLLTPAAKLHPWALNELLRVLAPGGTVYILGGTMSVSTAVQDEIEDYGITVRRLGGKTRYDVAVNVATELDGLRGAKPRAAFVSSGSAFADALVAGPPAALFDGPILLSNGPNLPAVTKTYLDSLADDADIFAVGGAGASSVVGDPRTEVVSGATRYDVAGNVAQRFFGYTYISGIADGRNWPDAASGGTFMAGLLEPILLTNGSSTLPSATSRYLLQSRASADHVVAFGGPSSIPSASFSAAIDAAGTQTTYYGPDTQP